jgi:multidrug efflux pump subunit AcrA (membrane-fusion protein)
LQRTDQLHVVVQLSAEHAPLVERGDLVDLAFEKLPGVRLPAQKIARFSPAINPSNGTMTVEIDVPNLDKQLMPGMPSSVTIHFKKSLPGALVVPSSCLPQIGPVGTYVYVVRDGKAHRTLIKVASEDGKNAEIEGVKASDLIVTNPKDLKGEVVPVEVKKEP